MTNFLEKKICALVGIKLHKNEKLHGRLYVSVSLIELEILILTHSFKIYLVKYFSTYGHFTKRGQISQFFKNSSKRCHICIFICNRVRWVRICYWKKSRLKFWVSNYNFFKKHDFWGEKTRFLISAHYSFFLIFCENKVGVIGQF